MTNYPRPIPTMDMVAYLAGVSRPAASYFFSPNENSHNRVSTQAGARLRDAATQIGFVPFANDAWFERFGRHLPNAVKHRDVTPKV